MIKRALFILVALIPCLTFAQRDLGEWKSYSRYTKVTQMEQTPDKIYYLSGNSLYSYDKNTNESYTYSSLNKLSDNTITNIYYNNNGKYLLIAYQTGNIDLLYDDGKVVNISNIKDVLVSYSPMILTIHAKNSSTAHQVHFPSFCNNLELPMSHLLTCHNKKLHINLVSHHHSQMFLLLFLHRHKYSFLNIQISYQKLVQNYLMPLAIQKHYFQ